MQSSPLDPTVELPPRGREPQAQRRVELVAGAGPRLSTEIQELLHARLRAVTAVLSAGFAIFLARQAVWEEMQSTGLESVFRLQVVTMIGLLLVAGIIFGRWRLSLAQLRWLELLLFLLPGVFLVYLQRQSLAVNLSLASAVNDEVSRADARTWILYSFLTCAAFWITLLYIYCLFIPNRWHRAALVVACMAAVPIVVSVIDRQMLPAARLAIPMGQLWMVSLMLIANGIAAVLGTYTIGALRQEAFRARQLGQYRLKQLLGAGGMGEVYLAEHMLLKRPCAIKLIRPGRETNPRALQRFEREVRATADLSHWNTVDVYDYGRTEDGTFYYVMEYLPGQSLAEIVQRFGPLPAGRAIHLLMQTCDALTEAHSRGLVHRDIKPGNIIACRRGGIDDVAKLCDFGLVKPLTPLEPELSQDGAVTGSPLYMAPEQAQADYEADARSDIYALGGVAYFCLTGRPPFLGKSALEVLVAHARDPVASPSSLGTNLSPALEQVVLRCLAKNPAERYATAAALKRALAACPEASEWNDTLASAWWQEHAGFRLRDTATDETSPAVPRPATLAGQPREPLAERG